MKALVFALPGRHRIIGVGGGRSHVDKLIADGELQRVPANREHADQLLAQAHKDLASAKLLLDANPKRAYESIYDAARMALTAVLENEGLRPTSRGGHSALRGGLCPA